MGRSVMTHSNAVATVYTDTEEHETCWEFEEYFLTPIINALINRYPSMRDERDANIWRGRELRVVAQNSHADVIVSEYCGTVAIQLVPTEQETDAANLSDWWCGQAYKGFRETVKEKCGRTMHKVGHMSNGVGVYKQDA